MLDVRRHGVPIVEAAARHSVSTGITFGIQIPGMVSWYEELEAQAARGITPAQWHTMTWQERALIIAHARIQRHVSLHQSDAVNEEVRRAQERKRGTS